MVVRNVFNYVVPVQQAPLLWPIHFRPHVGILYIFQHHIGIRTLRTYRHRRFTFSQQAAHSTPIKLQPRGMCIPFIDGYNINHVMTFDEEMIPTLYKLHTTL